MNMIELDGAQGEGGGQILRTALSLSMITGVPVRLNRIRARRQKPGLLRQHLTAVQAAADISGASVVGAVLGSTELEFVPGKVRGGDYQFAIGSAGSAMLVLQTLLPALWFAEQASSISVKGGTHNPMAPPVEFLQQSWLPLLKQMGIQSTLQLERHGFFPAGGGEVRALVTPISALRPLTLNERGGLVAIRAEARVAAVPVMVAKRELETLKGELPLTSVRSTELPAKQGPGNVVLVTVEFEHLTETVVGFGEVRLSAEKVAHNVATEARRYLDSGAAVSEHLADQLLLPMALAGGGEFTTHVNSSHLQTNAAVIERFLPVKISIENDNARWRVGIRPQRSGSHSC